MLFAFMCTDKPNHLDIRKENREAHLAFLDGLGDRFKAGGPFLDSAGVPSGSLVVIETEDIAEAQEIAAKDPYAIAGLFSKVDIRAWNWILKNPETTGGGN